MLKKMQAVSGLIFASFLLVHLMNTWLAATGAAAYDATQQVLRQVYQAAPVEILILTALLVHIVSGVARILIEPKRQLSSRARWHRYAGFFLLLVIAGHITAVRGASWAYNVYPEFSGLAFSIAAVPAYFYPYYFLLAVAGLYHGLNGAGIAYNRLSRRNRQLTLSNPGLARCMMAGVLLTSAALLGFGGWFFDVGDVAKSDFAKLTTGIAREVFGVTITP
jgi:succinate dehydrogenase/fumarate reductase cytochrome b subunit